MVLDPTVVSFTKAMQFILHGTNFPTASTASAYKYYVTLDNGKRIMMKCDNRKDAINEFRSMNLQGHHAVLTSRPDAGIMDVK